MSLRSELTPISEPHSRRTVLHRVRVRVRSAWRFVRSAEIARKEAISTIGSECQGRTESTSVAAAKTHQFEGWREWWFSFWQGEGEGGSLPRHCIELLRS